MKKSAKILLILIAVVCFGVALSYPISQYVQGRQNEKTKDLLTSLRDQGLMAAASVTDTPVSEAPAEEPTSEPDEETTPVPADETETELTSKPADQPDQELTSAPADEKKETQSEQPAGDAATAGAGTEQTAEPQAGQTAPSVTSGNEPQPEADVETTRPVKDENATAEATDQTLTETGEPTQEVTPEPTPSPTPRPSPSPTPDRRVRTGPTPWSLMEKVAFDESKILMQYRQLYELNNEMVGWMTIPGTYVDYPVMQSADDEYYLTHDFFKEENENGLLILDGNCDPYTPSYNLVVSGHNRWNKQMFSNLSDYQNKWYWEQHKFIQFDSLMQQRTYVVIAAFFAADYAVGEEGFRYNANIQFSKDAEMWLANVRDYQMYDTGIDAKFGDHFLTLTTCNSTRRKNGRFVVICRQLREGEVIE